MQRFFYSKSIQDFLSSSNQEILGELAHHNTFSLELTQRHAWEVQIDILKNVLIPYHGLIVFEFAIPRMGRRIDVVLIIEAVIFVLEFKVGQRDFPAYAIDQVWDYAVDLKNFHETSQQNLIAPILISTFAPSDILPINFSPSTDRVIPPLKTNANGLGNLIARILEFENGPPIDIDEWINGRYSPTPTIIQAAIALYSNHSVADVSRKDAAEANFTATTEAIAKVIEQSKLNNRKAICFVTGVPGAGKTLVGLDVATKNLDQHSDATSVFLSGNGPLVAVLREALTRDRVAREKINGNRVKKGEVMSEVKVFIQNVHHFRDECLIDPVRPPRDHVAVFDEAQRAWNLTQTASFMLQKKQKPNFTQSEPEFLISCLNRHQDWAVIICLVGGGQEINKGEAGITEWINSLNRSFSNWDIYISSQLRDSEYAAGHALELLRNRDDVFIRDSLHLSISMRSFRQENLSALVKRLLDLELEEARILWNIVKETYPIRLTRNLSHAKKWIRSQARGNERFGVIVSSQAQRLKPHAIDVKSPIDPVHWFLEDKSDVRSSYFMEDVATEFHVQGLELDWTCIVWDADFRFSTSGWQTFSFVADKWQHINKDERKQYLKNAYRVLLTRARQGMVIVVPEGDSLDITRSPGFYDCTYNYLKSIGFAAISSD